MRNSHHLENLNVNVSRAVEEQEYTRTRGCFEVLPLFDEMKLIPLGIVSSGAQKLKVSSCRVLRPTLPFPTSLSLLPFLTFLFSFLFNPRTLSERRTTLPRVFIAVIIASLGLRENSSIVLSRFHSITRWSSKQCSVERTRFVSFRFVSFRFVVRVIVCRRHCAIVPPENRPTLRRVLIYNEFKPTEVMGYLFSSYNWAFFSLSVFFFFFFFFFFFVA